MKPHIVVSSQDMEMLEALLDSLPSTAAAAKHALLEELSRAEVVEPHELPAGVVRMRSKVRFEIDTPREEFCMTLAYPRDMQNLSDGISVLTPVGSALLGLSVGDTIDWPRPDGQLLKVRILEVMHEPELGTPA